MVLFFLFAISCTFSFPLSFYIRTLFLDKSTVYGALVSYSSYDRCCDKYTKGKRGIYEYIEEYRITMTRRQIFGMINYIDAGFKKIRAPDKVFTLIKTFLDNNKEKTSLEGWSRGNT